jgi:hypothetical protein
MAKNILQTLLGKTFETKNVSIGNQIELLCGAKLSTSSKADLGFWEIKSRKADSLSPITLGGKATDNISLVLTQVYSKVKNVIVVEYSLNVSEFTVNSIGLLWDLDEDLFMHGLGKFYSKEYHKGMTVIRISEKNFWKMYGKKVIRYIA